MIAVMLFVMDSLSMTNAVIRWSDGSLLLPFQGQARGHLHEAQRVPVRARIWKCMAEEPEVRAHID